MSADVITFPCRDREAAFLARKIAGCDQVIAATEEMRAELRREYQEMTARRAPGVSS